MKVRACEEYLEKLEKELPEMCEAKDLIKWKIFNSPTAASEARITGNSPPFFQLGKRRRVMYPRGGVIDWLRGKINARYTNEKGAQGESIQQQ